MDLFVGSAVLSRAANIFGGDVLTALLNLPGNRQQGFQFVGYLGGLEVQLHLIHELFISPQTVSSHGAMSMLAKVAVVLRRDVGRDHLAIRRTQRVRRAQKHLCQSVERFRCFRAESHRP